MNVLSVILVTLLAFVQAKDPWVYTLEENGLAVHSVCQEYISVPTITTTVATVYPTVTLPSCIAEWPESRISSACSSLSVRPVIVSVTYTAPTVTVHGRPGKTATTIVDPALGSQPGPIDDPTSRADSHETNKAGRSPSIPTYRAQYPKPSSQTGKVPASRVGSKTGYPSSSFPNAAVTSTGLHLSNTTVTSTSVASTNTTIPTPGCKPDFVLDGVQEGVFNNAGPFSVRLTCGSLSEDNYTAFANWNVIEGLQASSTELQIPALSEGQVLLSLFAVTENGDPIAKSFDLVFGSKEMPVLVLDPSGQPAANAWVKADGTTFPGVSQSGYTDEDGKIVFRNLPETTIGLLARTSGNELGINGVATTTGLVTIKLMPVGSPGALDGFQGSSANKAKRSLDMLLNKREDVNLVVSTAGSSSLQTAQGTFNVKKGARKAFIKYQFITEEVPGGYFGSQYNDYFSVTIRSNTGAYATVTNSMNNLGLAAFDSSGATTIFTLEIELPPGTEYVTYDVAVSNVADALLQSQVIVSRVGDNECKKCGENCEECPDNASCQEECRNPTYSCDFYRRCAEPVVECGAEGYPLQYGERNCNKFVRNMGSFTGYGQGWIQKTMNCLQVFLVPVLETCPTCSALHAQAFDSHPDCYVNSGFCSLGCWDIAMVLGTVGMDLFESLDQIGRTALKCLADPLDTFGVGCGGDVLNAIALGTPQGRAVAIAILVVRIGLKAVLGTDLGS